MKRYLLILMAVLCAAGIVNAQTFGGGTIGPVPPDNTAYDSTTWDGDLRSATKNALRDQFVAVAGSPYDGLLIVAKTGAPYSTISSALAVATDGDTIAIYPGTYTETLTIADHTLTLIGMGDYNTVIVTQANANVVNFGGYAGITFRNMAFTVTAATTAISTVTGALGAATFENCHLAMTSAVALVAAAQPSVGAVTNSGTLNVRGGYFTYAHTGICGGTALKAAFTTANAGTINLDGLTTSTIVNSGTALTSTVFADSATSGNVRISDCEISVTDPDATSISGLGYLTGTGILHEFYRNRVHVTATNNNGYGFYAANTVTVSRFYDNHLHVVDTAGASYSHFIDAAATVIDNFGKNIAADGVSGTGTHIYVYSPSEGVFAVNGNVGIGTTNPAYKLDIVNSAGVAVMKIDGTGDGNAYAAFHLANGLTGANLRKWAYEMDTSNNFNARYYNGSTWDTKQVLQSTGNVGIGTTAPNAKFDVDGAINSRDYYWVDDFDDGNTGDAVDEIGAHEAFWTVGGTNEADNANFANGIGGIVELQANGALDNDSTFIIGEPIIAESANAIFEARVKIDDITTVHWVVGLVEGSYVSRDTLDDDIMLIGQDTDTGAANVYFISNDANAGAIFDDTGVNAVNNTYLIVKMDLTDTEQPRVWINNTEIAAGSITGTIQAGTTLMPYAMVQNLTTAQRKLTIDYIKAWQDRG